MTDEPKDLASQIAEAIKAVAAVDESDPAAHNLHLRVKKAELANIVIENESIIIAALSADPIAERKQRDAEIAGLRAENERLLGLLAEVRERDYNACKDALGLPLMDKIVAELDRKALRGSNREGDELKPCPFCGGDGKLHGDDGDIFPEECCEQCEGKGVIEEDVT